MKPCLRLPVGFVVEVVEDQSGLDLLQLRILGGSVDDRIASGPQSLVLLVDGEVGVEKTHPVKKRK
jgi:hypothetical protein